MSERSAPERRILEAVDASSRESAWTAFTHAYTPLLLHVARSLGTEHDAVMDRYAYVLEHLRRDDFRRLRAYGSVANTLFTTWLVVVARRLCLDHYRQRYGRAAPGDASPDARSDRAARARLSDLVSDGPDPDSLVTQAGDPEQALRGRELAAAIETALGALPAQSRLLIRLRFEDDLTAAEIAGILDLPSPFHVYRRVNQVLATLRRALAREGVHDAVP